MTKRTKLIIAGIAVAAASFGASAIAYAQTSPSTPSPSSPSNPAPMHHYCPHMQGNDSNQPTANVNT
jgi:hypothetical protein